MLLTLTLTLTHTNFDTPGRVGEEGEEEVGHGAGGGGAEIGLEDVAGVGDLGGGGRVRLPCCASRFSPSQEPAPIRPRLTGLAVVT